jgi:outer membrane lipoprotein-sorting protein
MRFLRTASTARLLTAITAVLVAISAGAAIAVAAVGGGPVARPASLASAVHAALAGPRVDGVCADITFTDNLIDSSDFTGQATDPLLQGASGRLWIGDGQLRIELQSGDGDAQIVVDHRSWWISDPTQNVVYEGMLPADAMGSGTTDGHGIPTVSEIRAEITRLMGAVDVSAAQPTDIAGQAAYRVTLSPKGGGGLVGSVDLAWDAVRGIPLSLDVYARGDATPVLGLTATDISYGPVPSSDFAVSPPAGATVVQLGDFTDTAAAGVKTHGRAITGVVQVAGHLNIPLHPPSTVLGLPLRSTRLVDVGGQDAALMVYGHGVGAVVVTETRAVGVAPANSPSVGGLSLPTRRIAGGLATVLSTPLGTLLDLRLNGVADTIVGSITSADAQTAASQFTAGQ